MSRPLLRSCIDAAVRGLINSWPGSITMPAFQTQSVHILARVLSCCSSFWTTGLSGLQGLLGDSRR